MKVVTRFSHSIPKLVCPDGPDGLLISTLYLTRTVEINTASMIITVESGVTLKELIEQAAAAGLALVYTPYWSGLTIGGMLGTGAHGSTLWGAGSAVHDYVVGLKIVTPAAHAAKLSLGVLGVISQVTVKLQAVFKRSVTFSVKDDSDLGDTLTSFGHLPEFADLTWYPNQRKAVYRLDDRVSSSVSGDGVDNFIPFRATPSLALALIRSSC